MDINSITWKGVSSTTIGGLIIQELPPITLPPMRVDESVVDGRDGSIIEELGYGSYDKAISIGLFGNYDIDSIISFFTGEGNLVLSNEPNRIYRAKIVSQIDFNRLVTFRTAIVNFRVQPYKHRNPIDSSNSSMATRTISNHGNTVSKPIITIQGSGTISLKVDNVEIFSYTYPNNETSVTIDCEKEDAYNGTNLRNRYMTGEFPSIPTGQHTIKVTGTMTNMNIEKISRWL